MPSPRCKMLFALPQMSSKHPCFPTGIDYHKRYWKGLVLAQVANPTLTKRKGEGVAWGMGVCGRDLGWEWRLVQHSEPAKTGASCTEWLCMGKRNTSPSLCSDDTFLKYRNMLLDLLGLKHPETQLDRIWMYISEHLLSGVLVRLFVTLSDPFFSYIVPQK